MKQRILHRSIGLAILAFSALGLGLSSGKTRVQTWSFSVTATMTCNWNGVCESEEWNSYQTGDKQSCPDCRPKTYPALQVDQAFPQFILFGDGSDWQAKRVFQIKLTGTEVRDGEILGIYRDTWASGKPLVNYRFPMPHIGDVDNDGDLEVVAVVTSDAEGSKILIYETGAGDEPTWESPKLLQGSKGGSAIRIFDIDRDGRNELLMVIDNCLWIYRLTPELPPGSGYVLTEFWKNAGFGDLIYSMNIADADNQGDPEIVLGLCGKGSPYILKYIGADWALQPIEIPPTPPSCVDIAAVGDLDVEAANGNEIITGGNDRRLHVWKYENGTYKHKAVSEDLGGLTQGVDVGDIDGIPGNEVVTAASSAALIVLKYADGRFQRYLEYSLYSASTFVKVLDCDGDHESEILVGSNGFNIFDFVNQKGALVRTFNGFRLGGGIGW